VLDLDRLRAAPLSREPYEFVVVDEFVRRDELAALLADCPRLARHGSFPIEATDGGPHFARLLGELTGPGLRTAIAEKFALDLEGRPTMLTLRGWSDGKDGRIHTDATTKLITLLLYLNPSWEAAEGRLRILRSATDLDDYAAEIAPLAGTMLAFRRSERSYHGHLAHRGERRVLQLNWVTGEDVVRREIGRHRWSARLKTLNPFA